MASGFNGTTLQYQENQMLFQTAFRIIKNTFKSIYFFK